MLAKQIQKNNKDFEEDVFWTEEWDGSLSEIRYVLKQSQLSIIDTMIKCQKQEEQRLQMIKLKSYLGLSDEDIGIKMGELRQCRRTLDYLKTEMNYMDKYVDKMMDIKAKKIDDGVFLSLRTKPRFLPKAIWYKLIKMFININYFN